MPLMLAIGNTSGKSLALASPTTLLKLTAKNTIISPLPIMTTLTPTPPKKNQPQNSNKPKTLSSSNSIANVLGKDGKLTQERQRYFDNNLYMACGDVGHMANNCPKSKSAKAKACAAQAKKKPEESDDLKNSKQSSDLCTD